MEPSSDSFVSIPGLSIPTFFSSFVGGALKNVSSGAYRKHKTAMPANIHSKPIVLTSVPLKIKEVNTYFVNKTFDELV